MVSDDEWVKREMGAGGWGGAEKEGRGVIMGCGDGSWVNA